MSQPEVDVEVLIQRAKTGEQAAISKLYEMHAQQIYRYVVYRVPDEDAEDITADVFVKMVEGLPSYTLTGAPFEAWLYRIAAARVSDYHRRRNRRPQTELFETLSDDAPTPEERLQRQQELAGLREQLSQLGDEQQHVLLLRFVERKTHAEVAEIIGKSVTAVKSIQHRALNELANLMGKDKKAKHYLRGRSDS